MLIAMVNEYQNNYDFIYIYMLIVSAGVIVLFFFAFGVVWPKQMSMYLSDITRDTQIHECIELVNRNAYIFEANIQYIIFFKFEYRHSYQHLFMCMWCYCFVQYDLFCMYIWIQCITIKCELNTYIPKTCFCYNCTVVPLAFAFLTRHLFLLILIVK